MAGSRKLVLVVVDALKPEMLERAIGVGAAPTFAALLERGEYVPDCVSTFPSVTPVASATIATGSRPDVHRIPGSNWLHRVEGRYVEYGSSFMATRTFGIVRTLYDIVYNMNLAHLNPAATTIFEALGDAGLRTVCTPFLIYRGRKRHEMSLEGALRRVAMAATFRHAVYGPDELFYGELYASRRVPCKPTLARPGTRDEYSACVGVEMMRDDLYDFMLFSLPDNDHHSHHHGPHATLDSIQHADRSLGRLFQAAGGIDEFLADHAVILVADHSQTPVDWPIPIAGALAEEWRVLKPADERPEQAEIAVGPSARAASIYLLMPEERRPRAHARVRAELLRLEGVDLATWLLCDGSPARRDGGTPPGGELEAVVASERGELRFRPGSQLGDRRGARWDVEGDLEVLEARQADGALATPAYPDALGRLWAALTAPHAGDVVLSARLGYEFVDWGGVAHLGGGSHGSLHRADSVAPLAFVGCGPQTPAVREEWGLQDVSEHVLEAMGVGPGAA